MVYYPNRDILVGIEGDILVTASAYKNIAHSLDFRTDDVKTEYSQYFMILDLPLAYKAKSGTRIL